MKKNVLLLLLLVCLVLPVAVYAGPPEDVIGYFNYEPTGCSDEKWGGDNYFGRDCRDTGKYGFLPNAPDVFYGDFIGESDEKYVITLHGADPVDPYFTPFRMGWYKGIVEFKGTVLDSEPGTMWIQYVGKSPGSIFVWSGTWQILDGIDGLEGIHGGGTWESCPTQVQVDLGFFVCLEGKVHFN